MKVYGGNNPKISNDVNRSINHKINIEKEKNDITPVTDTNHPM